MTLLVLALCLVCFSSVCRCHVTNLTCPPAWLNVGQSCVYFSPKSTVWYEAEENCQSMNSSLVIVEDSPTDNELNKVFQKNKTTIHRDRQTFWTGHYTDQSAVDCSVPWNPLRMEGLRENYTKFYCYFWVPDEYNSFYQSSSRIEENEYRLYICQRSKQLDTPMKTADATSTQFNASINADSRITVSGHEDGVRYTNGISGSFSNNSFRVLVEQGATVQPLYITSGKTVTNETKDFKVDVYTGVIDTISGDNIHGERTVDKTRHYLDNNQTIKINNMMKGLAGNNPQISEEKIWGHIPKRSDRTTTSGNNSERSDETTSSGNVKDRNEANILGNFSEIFQEENNTSIEEHQTLNTAESESNTIHSGSDNHHNESPDQTNVLVNEDHPNTDLILPVSVCTAVLFIAIFVAVVCLCQTTRGK
ncbi:hypothetical protein Btru_032263 [Bulinus truncatus]|nr:hypothetical protein Btru_032263 [Bulinus truncatus]